MRISANEVSFRARKVAFGGGCILVQLFDGREVKTPLSFYPILAKANSRQLHDYRFIGQGHGIHWNELDEDLSVESIVLGKRAVIKMKCQSRD